MVRVGERHASPVQSSVVLAGGVPTRARVRTVLCLRGGTVLKTKVLPRSPKLALLLGRKGLVDAFLEVNIRSVLSFAETFRGGTVRDSRGARVRVVSRSGRSVPRGPRVGGAGFGVAISRDVSKDTIGTTVAVVVVVAIIPSLLVLTMLTVAVGIVTVEMLGTCVVVIVDVTVVAVVAVSVAMVVLLVVVDITVVLELAEGTVPTAGEVSAPPNVDIEVLLSVDISTTATVDASVEAVAVAVFAKSSVLFAVILTVLVGGESMIGVVVAVAWMKVVTAVGLADAIAISVLECGVVARGCFAVTLSATDVGRLSFEDNIAAGVDVLVCVVEISGKVTLMPFIVVDVVAQLRVTDVLTLDPTRVAVEIFTGDKNVLRIALAVLVEVIFK